ncbi:heavy-metal-associated domain-containing protein [Tissierella sp.]|uniref:heavy-metal-associated domain-containing protein n=1 Tax=Tissierella sp. TaxID=41274 RepID=UPI00285E962A|nr:heavy-metal-associated domain-containing protein [Tissierella sp.]MDR7855244.1 heavy-metal-associated domain-containing protein [Tissierella sp.]
MTKAVFQLEQVTCPSCISKIETSLKKIAGVEDVEVLFNASRVRAQFDESQVRVEQLGQIIEKLGYPVLSIRAS